MTTKLATGKVKLTRVSHFSCEGCFYRKPSICPVEKRRECSKYVRERKYYIFKEVILSKAMILLKLLWYEIKSTFVK